MSDPETEERFRQCLKATRENESAIHSFGIGDRIAMALIANRLDWLPSQYTHSVLEAIERLGEYRLKAALNVQRQDLQRQGLK